MPYINPAQLIQDRFKSPLDAVLPIVPSFMANKRARDQLAFQQAQAAALQPYHKAQTEKLIQDIRLDPRRVAVQEAANVGLPEYRTAQTTLNTEQAAKLKLVNDYLRLMGGADIKEGKGLPYDITPEEFFKSQLNLPQQTLKPIFREGKWIYDYPKQGEEAKPEHIEQTYEIKYWLPGDLSPRMERRPASQYNARMDQLRALEARFQEPFENVIERKKQEYEALQPLKLENLKAQLKARGIDTDRWSDQQKKWLDAVRFVIGNTQMAIATSTSVKDQETALWNLSIKAGNEIDRIDKGLPPTFITVGAEAVPQPLMLPERRKDESEEAYQKRVQRMQRGVFAPRQAPPQTQGPVKRLPGETVEQYMQRVGQ